jgi:hypothetical protein
MGDVLEDNRRWESVNGDVSYEDLTCRVGEKASRRAEARHK